MNYNAGFSAQYYGHFVDPASWRDLDRFEIVSGSVTRNETDLRTSARIDLLNYTEGERWVRIYLDAKQGANAAHVPLFTGLTTSPADDIHGTIITNQVECYSVLKPAADILLDRGWYAPVGASGAGLIAQLLNTPAPIDIAEGSPELAEPIIAEDGETQLSMSEKILLAIGWRMKVTGDGVIHLTPKATEPVAKYDALENDAVEPDITVKYDWFTCPNVFRAVSGDLVGIAKDEDPASPLSIPARGREVWAEDTSAELNTGETIAEYAMRRLKEEQERATTAKYNRRFHPDIYPSDIVRLNYPAQGLMGDFLVNSQSIDLSYGARTGEEVTHE